MPQDPKQYLEGKLEQILQNNGVPAVGAVMVRNGGDSVLTVVKGKRKWDSNSPSNPVQLTDRWSLGSVSKPVTGFLLSHLIGKGALGSGKSIAWTTRIGEVFPEFQDTACRAKFGMRTDFLNATVEQLMAHSAGQPYAPTNGFEMILGSFSGAHLSEYSSPQSLAWRRYLYVISSMQDMALPASATNRYSGGSIVVASMMERLTGKPYEEMLQEMIFAPLGMNHSNVGRLADSVAPNGIWEHPYNPDTGAIQANADATADAFNFYSHAPAGRVCMSVGDMATFIRHNLVNSGKPKPLVSDALLSEAQAKVSSMTAFTRAGWILSGPPNDPWLSHNGNNCLSCASLTLWPADQFGFAAFCNTSTCATDSNGNPRNNIGNVALNDINQELRNMQSNWSSLFG